jgi:hypothetical protein
LKHQNIRKFAVSGLALSLIAILINGCGVNASSPEEEVVETTHQALTETVTIRLPNVVTLDQVALGLTAPGGRLAINDGASVTGAVTYVPSTNSGKYAVYTPTVNEMVSGYEGGTLELGVSSRADEVTSVPNVLVRGNGTASSIRTAGTVTLQAPQSIPSANITQNVSSLKQYNNVSFNVDVPSAGTREVTVQPDQPTPVPLSPGGYGRVTVNRNSTLALSAGAYRFSSLIIEAGSTILIDNAAGTSNISVDNELIVRGRIAPSAPQLANLLFYYRGTNTPAIDSHFLGTLLAPNASVVLPSDKTHTGSFFGKNIEVHQRAVVRHRAYAPNAAAQACGGSNQACCAHDWCESGRCDQGTCRTDHCGWSGEACCSNNSCASGLTCFIPPAQPCSGIPDLACPLVTALLSGMQKPNTCFGPQDGTDVPNLFNLSESIFVDPAVKEDVARDVDKDWLKDDMENRLAEAFRPYFIFDEQENDLDDNISEPSLLPWEPRTLFQVHVENLTRPTWLDPLPRTVTKIIVKYLFLWRLDGGFRNDALCTDWHYGDSQSGTITFTTTDGKTILVDRLNLGQGGDRPAYDPDISTIAGYASFGPTRHPVIYLSAGKHHQYMTAAQCEASDTFCNDDCGGGFGYDLGALGNGTGPRYADVRPVSQYFNIGETNAHPSPTFVDDLAPLGYPTERVWWPNWLCNGKECFTGGLGADWHCARTQCTEPGSVKALTMASDWVQTPY